MSNKAKLYKRISDAKSFIRKADVKKEGKNTFAKYEYFTPGQIESLTAEACEKNGLVTTFDLVRELIGDKIVVTGVMRVVDTETGEEHEARMATAIPEIKATNLAQQLGGTVTYTERYLKMSIFGITDHSLDFDTTENTKERAVTPAKSSTKSTQGKINEKQIKLVNTLLSKKGVDKDKFLEYFHVKSVKDITTDIIQKVIDALNSKPEKA